MYAMDFEYDGRYLSDYGFIICTLGGSSDFDVVSAGSKITFNKVARHRGKIHSLSGTRYDDCVTATFDICKNPDLFDDLRIGKEEYRELMRWLNRNEFKRFWLLGAGYDEPDCCYFNASFNVDKVLVNRELVGLELTMETDKPFGYAPERYVSWTITDTTKTYVLNDSSDEIGFIYPNMKITCNGSGNLTVYNELEDCTMVINNCSAGEVITVDGSAQIITSSLSSHRLYDDFNFEFFRIGNTINDRMNRVSVSIPCKLEIRYSPIIKDTPE